MRLANDAVIDELWTILQDRKLEFDHLSGPGSAFPEDHMRQQPDKLHVPMRKFKPRRVDPSYIRSDGTVTRLSEQDREYADDLQRQKDATNDRWGKDWARENGDTWANFTRLTVAPEVKVILTAHNPELL
jgi:hypothetical protein